MQYALLIYDNESAAPEPGSPEADEIFQRYMSFTQDITTEGVNKGGEALYPIDSATTVRIRNGELQVTDGPFAETKEQLGGFYILDCKDLDEALAWAAKIPTAHHGSVEVRPIMVFD